MALELSSIVFKATTDELDAAVKKIETLGKSVEGLASSLGKLDKESAAANKTQAQANLLTAKAATETAKAATETAKASAITTKAQDQNTAATERLTKATKEKQSVEQQQEAITRIMSDGYSRGQATILARAEALGEVTTRTAELLKTQRAMQASDPFDKSIGAVTLFENRTRVLTVANDLYQQSLGFTKEQLMDLGREHVRLSEQFKVQGKDMGGLDAEFQKIVQSAQRVTQVENTLATSMKNADKATIDAGRANAYIENELQKVRFALQANNDELNRSTANSLVKFENNLKRSGLTLDQQKLKIDEYRKAQIELQKTQSANKTDYITRAVGPQITDIIVGLSTGQSPLTVMMQQGGQLRDQFGMMGIAAADMATVMRTAMAGMAQSVFDTGKAIGGMLVGGIYDAGKAVNNFIMDISGLNKRFDDLKRGYASLGEEGFSKISRLMRLQSIAAGVVAGSLAALVVSILSVGIAFVQVTKAQDDLTKSLVSSGAQLGLSSIEAIGLAESLGNVGATSVEILTAFKQMTDSGNISRESLVAVAEAALLLESAGGKAASKTIEMFAKLADKPMETLSEYAQKTGLVNQAEIARIETLVKLGNEITATEEATKILTQATQDEAAIMLASLSDVSRLWLTVKSGISNAWRAVQEFAGSSDIVAPFKFVLQTIAIGATQVWFAVKGMGESLGGLGAIAAAVMTDIKNLDTNFTASKGMLGAIQEQDNARNSSYKDAIAQILQQGKYSREELNKTAALAATGRKATADAEKDRVAHELAMKPWREQEQKSLADNLTKQEFIKQAIDKTNKALTEGKTLRAEEISQITKLAGADWDKSNKPKKAKLSDEQKKENKALEDYIDLMNKAVGLNKDYNNILDGLQLRKKNGKLTEEEYVKAVEELIKQQKFYTDGLAQEEKQLKLVQKAWADTNKEQEKKDNEYIKAYDALKAETLELKNVTSEIEFQFGLLGKTEEQQKLITREHKQQNDLGKVQVELEKELQKIREAGLDPDLEIIARENAAEKIKAINANIALQFAQDMQKEFDAIKSSITDSITTALFDGGKAGSKKIKDAIVSVLRSKVTLYVDAVVNTVMQSGMNALGLGASAAGASGSMGGIGGLMNGVSSVSGMATIGQGIANLLPASFSSALGLTSSALQTSNAALLGGGSAAEAAAKAAGAAGNAIALSSMASTAGSILSYASALNSLSEGKIGAAAGTALGQYFGGPIGAFIGGQIGAALDEAFAGETRSGASYTSANGKAVFEKGPSGGEIAGKESKLLMENAMSAITGTLKAVGSKATLTGFVAGLESSDNGKGFNYAGGKINGKAFGESLGRDGGQFDMVSQDAKTAFANYGKELSQSILEALQITEDIPKSLKVMLEGIDIEALTTEETDALLKTVNTLVMSVTGFNDTMVALPFEYLKNLSFDTAAGLIAAGGGLESLMGNLSGFYDNFYTETEKTANLTNTTSAAFAELGIIMPAINEATREWYRSEVERLGLLDQSIEANRVAYTSALSLWKSVDTLAPAFDALTEAQKELLSINQSWTDKLNILKGTETDRSIALRDATDDSTRAIMLQVYAQEDLKIAFEASTKLLSDVSTSFDSLLTQQLTSAKNQAQESYDLLVRSVEREKKVLTGAYDARVKELTEIQDEYVQSTSTSLDTLSKSVDNLRSLSEKLKSTLDGMNVSGSEGTQRSLAQRLIKEVLGTARTTGALPADTRELENALSTVSEPSEELFASFTDYARDFYKTKNDISALSDITDASLTEQEKLLNALETQTKAVKDGFDRQLKALKAQYDINIKPLDDTLALARGQLDMLNNINTGITTVSAALAQFTTSVNNALSIKSSVQGQKDVVQKTQEQKDLEATKALNAQERETVVNAANQIASQLGISPEEALYSYSKTQNLTPDQVDKIMGFPTGTTKDWAISKGLLQAPTAVDTAYNPVEAQSLREQAIAGAALNNVSPEMFLYNYARNFGFTASTVDSKMGWPEGTTNSWAKANGLPTFASGGYYGGGMALVGEEGPELINFSNPGQVYTAPQTQNLLGGGDNSRMELLLVNLNENITGLRYEIRADVSHNSSISKLLNRVSPDGQSLAVSFIEPQEVNVV